MLILEELFLIFNSVNKVREFLNWAVDHMSICAVIWTYGDRNFSLALFMDKLISGEALVDLQQCGHKKGSAKGGKTTEASTLENTTKFREGKMFTFSINFICSLKFFSFLFQSIYKYEKLFSFFLAEGKLKKNTKKNVKFLN